MTDEMRLAVELVEESGLDDVSLYGGYAEPGYTCDAGVAVSNWNDPSVAQYDEDGRYTGRIVLSKIRSNLSEKLEELGFEIEWDDEWASCDECGLLVRTSADSYCWTRHYVDIEGSIICRDCLEADEDEMKAYLESMEGNYRACTTFDVDFSKYGYQKVELDFENGFHEGMDDSPQRVSEALDGIPHLFELTEQSQFYSRFAVWVRDFDPQVAKQRVEGYGSDGPSVSEGLKRALQGIQHPVPSPGKVAVTKVDVAKGTSETKMVSHEDFINGKALD
jgi:hypothetical protein